MPSPEHLIATWALVGWLLLVGRHVLWQKVICGT